MKLISEITKTVFLSGFWARSFEVSVSNPEERRCTTVQSAGPKEGGQTCQANELLGKN
jgi:hypothetical protein